MVDNQLQITSLPAFSLSTVHCWFHAFAIHFIEAESYHKNFATGFERQV
jgi:hypothetical protein